MEQTPTNESVTDPGLQLDDSITCEKAEDKEDESAKTGSLGWRTPRILRLRVKVECRVNLMRSRLLVKLRLQQEVLKEPI
ncbi:hypothetical protein EB796_016416 [Bugula neritina]|uniref:Uncharacterized protein n=1 Tax=Bugula neritina TaxID=10212 RepID=A0A7J7JIF1_BUGNE|nr:hypothetical protein EB796_016416 [Bugula neritina]